MLDTPMEVMKCLKINIRVERKILELTFFKIKNFLIMAIRG